jgi:selenide,water dikinase
VATTDFFMPIVDDPYDFGRIAATNALSDVYAMGGTPIMALALVGMPVNQLPVDVIAAIIRGGQDVPRRPAFPSRAGTPSTRSSPSTAWSPWAWCTRIACAATPARGRATCWLGKPLGVGVYSAALKKEQLGDAHYREMIASTTRLNTPARCWPSCPACTPSPT